MSTADPEPSAAGDPTDVATRLSGASFVRVVARADGDGVAAAGVLARALSSVDTPFQVSAARTVETRTERVERAATHAGDDEVTVLVGGAAAPDAVRLDAADGPASVAAWRVAREVGEDADPVLALAGAVAAGVTPGAGGTAPVLEAARESGLGRRPGVAVPTRDLADGLAHSTLVHAPFSGDVERARSALAEVGVDPEGDAGPERGRTAASLVAIEVAGHGDATPGAAESVERALRPAVPGDRFRTLGGYADVLDAVARERPGTAVALALGRDVRDPALSAWRDHASRAHSAVRAASTGRYDGLFAARVDAESVPVGTVARLLGAHRSPEPVTLVVAGGRAGAVAEEPADLGRAMRSVAGALDGRADGTPRRAYAEFEDADPTAVVAEFREAIP
jgi:hypothetical protein